MTQKTIKVRDDHSTSTHSVFWLVVDVDWTTEFEVDRMSRLAAGASCLPS